MRLRVFPWFEILLVTLVMAIHLYAATSDAYNFPNRWFIRDDAYYYFKVAQNIAEGHGSTFDGINPTNGYHPLWLLLCIPIFALARFDLILPLRILLLVQAALSAATGILLYRLTAHVLSRPVGVVIALAWVTNSYLHETMYTVGLETGLAAFFVTLLLYLIFQQEQRRGQRPPSTNEIVLIAIVAVLTLLSRLDLIFFVVLIGLWVIVREPGLRVLLPLDIVLFGFSIPLAVILRVGFPDYYLYTSASLRMTLLAIALKVVLFFFSGLYQPAIFLSGKKLIQRLVITSVTAITGLSIIMLAFAPIFSPFPRSALVVDGLLTLTGAFLLRVLAYLFVAPQNSLVAHLSPLQTLLQNGQTWLKKGLIYYGIVGGSLATYLLYNQLTFGVWMPISGQVKRWWGSLLYSLYGRPSSSILQFLGIDPSSEYNAWAPFTTAISALHQKWGGMLTGLLALLTLIALAWLILLLRKRHTPRQAIILLGLPTLFAASVLQILGYNITGYAAIKAWYWITQPLFLWLASALFLESIVAHLRARMPAPAIWSMVTVIALWLTIPYLRNVISSMPHGIHPSRPPYLQAARFLQKHTPPGSIIGMTGGGNIGYFLRERTIINMDGLINSPAYFKALQNQQAGQYLAREGMNYIFANPNLLQLSPYFGQFPTGATLATWGGKDLLQFTP